MYSSAAVNPSPAPSTASRQRSQVSTVTSCPRAASARASAIAGNACPGSPNAATSKRRALTAHARACKIRSRARARLTSRLTSRDHCSRCDARPAIPPSACASPSTRLPRHTRSAMLRGIDANRIIVGAYVDRDSGGDLPDARRAPKRRPHQPRQLRPRLGPLHRRPAAPPRHRREVAHAAQLPRAQPRPRRPSLDHVSIAELAGRRSAPSAASAAGRTCELAASDARGARPSSPDAPLRRLAAASPQPASSSPAPSASSSARRTVSRAAR